MEKTNVKKILIVNNNMNIGGVQKALINLLNEIERDYNITLLLFNANGEYYSDIPENVKVIECKSLFRYFGISQKEVKKSFVSFICRSILAVLTKLFGRGIAVLIAGVTQRKLKVNYDIAISYLHSGAIHSFYGGCNEFVLKKVTAQKKITFLHGDYARCGANDKLTNKLYHKFDIIAACSEGCKNSFLSIMPDMKDKCVVVPNCHNFERIKHMALADIQSYQNDYIHVISIARLSPEKGIERALRAVYFVKNKGIQILYHIIGDGIEKNALIDLKTELGLDNNVFFYGNQKNPYKYLTHADLLLIPSYHEAAPLVIDEARCLGVPILTTNTISSDDMVIKRNIGWVCKNTQESINNTLLNILSNSRILKEKKKEMLTLIVNNDDAVNAFSRLIK